MRFIPQDPARALEDALGALGQDDGGVIFFQLGSTVPASAPSPTHQVLFVIRDEAWWTSWVRQLENRGAFERLIALDGNPERRFVFGWTLNRQKTTACLYLAAKRPQGRLSWPLTIGAPQPRQASCG